MRRPPALAFATVLLLVGGALVVTRHVVDDASTGPARSMTATPMTRAAVPPPAMDAKQGTANHDVDGVLDGDAAGGPGGATPTEDAKAAAGTGAGRAVRVQSSAERVTNGAIAKPSAASVPPAKKAPSRRADLYRKAATAARRGECATVRDLLAQLAALEPLDRSPAPRNDAIAKCMNE
jgi:hypothetical protein